MPVVEIRKDPQALTMTVVAQFAAPVARVWAAYADARQIERFWGPPEWPATFARHDFKVGGRSEYTMNGPDGQKSSGYWEFIDIDEPRSFEVKDGFLGEDGKPNAKMPSMRMRFTFEPHDNGTRMTTVTTFPSIQALDELLKMGMEEGMKAAMGQIDAVLAENPQTRKAHAP
jgi:uncharacterized protein YndB with AHSA1/START domain